MISHHFRIVAQCSLTRLNNIVMSSLCPCLNSQLSILNIKYDLKDCNIFLTETEIKCMIKDRFKSLVKESTRELARNYLIQLKNTHSKSKYLDDRFVMQPYLLSSKLTLVEKQLLFKLRTYTFECKMNFRHKYPGSLECFCRFEDCQEHFINNCSILENKSNIKYSDLYGSLEEQGKLVKFFTEVDNRRKSISLTSSFTGSH